MIDILLKTKLGIPPCRKEVVYRARLLNQISTGLTRGDEYQRKLTLVSAPAGYGKTTLIAEWLNELEIQSAWVTLDGGDNDPTRFLAYLVAAIQSTYPKFGSSVYALIQSPQAPSPEIIQAILVNELSTLPAQLILVLDDYHVITSISIHRLLAFILEHMPSSIHLVLITREDPLIPISRLRAINQVCEIRQEELRFSLEETVDFLSRVMHLTLSSDDILALERRTEGWIAGLQLAGLSLHGIANKSSFIQDFTGSNRYILDYLIEEVFNHQPVDLRDFLLKTSILDRLSGPLCDAVTAGTGSQEVLERLERANMFILPLGQSRTWYRYHRLFSELLQHQQRMLRSEIDLAELNQRASCWFEAQGYTDEAIQYALAAQDWERAGRLIGGVNDRMFKNGEIVSLLGWMEKLPKEMVLSHPNLCMVYAWALLLTGKYDLAEPVLHKAEQLAPPASIFLGRVATAQAYLARSTGDNSRVIDTSRLALELLPESEPAQRGTLLMNLGLAYWHEGRLSDADEVLIEAQNMALASGNLYGELTSVIFLARTLASRGLLRKAAEKYPLLIQRGPNVPVIALACVDLGSIYYEWDQLEQAECLAEQGLELSRRTGTVEFQTAGLILQSYIYTARQAWTEAQRAADLAWKLAQDYSVQIKARCSACRAQVALSMGDVKSAQHWLEQTPIVVDCHPFYRFSGLIKSRLLLAQEGREAAFEQLKGIEQVATESGWGYALVALRLQQCLAAETSESATKYMTDALRMAEPDGYLRTFVDAGLGIVPYLQHIAQHGEQREYAGKLLSALGARTNPSKIDRPALIEPLTDREIEVLKLVAAGLSNREIAGRLYISPGTAKTHIHNLWGKLGVRNRIEAVSRAKELNLI